MSCQSSCKDAKKDHDPVCRGHDPDGLPTLSFSSPLGEAEAIFAVGERATLVLPLTRPSRSRRVVQLGIPTSLSDDDEARSCQRPLMSPAWGRYGWRRPYRRQYGAVESGWRSEIRFG